jgi:hypothetical protein
VAVEKLKRSRWLQFGLSTAIVTVSTAGLLVALNAVRQYHSAGSYFYYTCGWPYAAYWSQMKWGNPDLIGLEQCPHPEEGFNWLWTFYNAAICFGIILLVSIIAEFYRTRSFAR